MKRLPLTTFRRWQACKRGIGKPLLLGMAIVLTALAAFVIVRLKQSELDDSAPVDAAKLQGAPIRSAPAPTTAQNKPAASPNPAPAALSPAPPAVSEKPAALPANQATAPETTGTILKPPAAPPVGEPAAGSGEYLPLAFTTLGSYTYETPDPTDAAAIQKDQIPDEIKALSGKRVAIQGFIVPLQMDGGKMTRFILTNSRAMCCFGVSPFMNEWVSVRSDLGTEYFKDILTTVYGTLEVGEEKKDGYVLNIYRMKADKLAVNSGF